MKNVNDMCKCDMEDFTKDEINAICANEYVYIWGFYESVEDNLKEYWGIKKQCCDRNGFEKDCKNKQCKKYI